MELDMITAKSGWVWLFWCTKLGLISSCKLQGWGSRSLSSKNHRKSHRNPEVVWWWCLILIVIIKYIFSVDLFVLLVVRILYINYSIDDVDHSNVRTAGKRNWNWWCLAYVLHKTFTRGGTRIALWNLPRLLCDTITWHSPVQAP